MKMLTQIIIAIIVMIIAVSFMFTYKKEVISDSKIIKDLFCNLRELNKSEEVKQEAMQSEARHSSQA